MKRQEIESIGVSGVSVELNHSELVAIKGFVNQLKKTDEDTNNKYRYNERIMPLVASMILFLEKIVPHQLMSVDEAYAELFAPVAKSPADNEL